MMPTGQQAQVLVGQHFEAAITGMALNGELSLRQPAAQRFGIDAEATTAVG